MGLLVCVLLQLSLLKAEIQHSVQSLAKTLLGLNSLDNILLRRQHQFPAEPSAAGPHFRAPTRPSSLLCSLALCTNRQASLLCSRGPPVRLAEERRSRAPWAAPRGSAPRLLPPVLASSPPRPVLHRPGANPSPSPGPFGSHPPCVPGPAPAAFVLACKHHSCSVKRTPARS